MPETLTIGSLFSGYGGLDMAVEQVTGATPAWFVEYDEAPSKILAHHWPDVPNYGDVTTVDWETIPPVDILTGGYPCQPFSQAGQRKGTTDDRHLWPHVREAIRVLRPRLTILENVAGHRSLGFDRVLGDMAEDGLHVRWTSIRASDIGAPHHRERLFILAMPADTDGERWGQGAEQPIAGPPEVTAPVGSEPPAAHPGCPAVGEHPGESPAEEAGPEGSHGPGDTRGERPAQIGREGTTDPEGWGPYAEAVRRWERVTRPAAAPTELNTKGKPRLNAAFAEWMMGLPEGHVTQVPGISRAEQLKAIGNGVCPQQAAAALTQLLTSPATAGLFS